MKSKVINGETQSILNKILENNDCGIAEFRTKSAAGVQYYWFAAAIGGSSVCKAPNSSKAALLV